MHKTLRGTLASHSTQGSHSKGLNHGFWGLHAPLQPQNGRASSSSPSRVGALLIRRYGRIEEMGAVSSHPPTRTGWVPTTALRHALAAFDTPPRPPISVISP